MANHLRPEPATDTDIDVLFGSKGRAFFPVIRRQFRCDRGAGSVHHMLRDYSFVMKTFHRFTAFPVGTSVVTRP